MLLEGKQIWDFYHSIRAGAGLPKAEGRDTYRIWDKVLA
jgi:hypothetical protein